MRSTAADYPMIRLAIVLAAAVMLLLVAWQGGASPLPPSLLPLSSGITPDGATGTDAKRSAADGSAADGYRIINEGTDSSEVASGEHLALRFKETEAKQGMGSADDQRPRPALGGSNRGKSSKQS